MSDGVNVVKAGDILEVTIDRPKANAIDLAASRRLNDIFTSFRDDKSLKIAIITGAGDRFFSPGWDLKAAAAGEKSDEEWGVGGFGGLNYPRNLNKPIIAAVNGIACGGGFEVVLGTDIIVMEEHAKFALPEINVAVLADAGTTHSLPCSGGISAHGPLDGCRRSKALGACKSRGAQRCRHDQGARNRPAAGRRAAAPLSGDQAVAASY
jgi:enoyl-CoA hydratase/carnithine racemase